MTLKRAGFLTGLVALVISNSGCYKSCSFDSPLTEDDKASFEDSSTKHREECSSITEIKYINGYGIVSTNPNSAKYLCLTETNLSLLYFDAAASLAEEGYGKGRISVEEYQLFQKNLQYQRSMESIIVSRERKQLGPDEDWSEYLSETEVLIGKLCTYKNDEVVPFQEISHNFDLLLIMQYSYGIKAMNTNDRLLRANQILLSNPELYDVALEDLTIFIGDQKGVPSINLATAYDLQTRIYERKEDYANGTKARENGMKLREQGYVPPVHNLLLPQ
jgi:hypothetical protein